MLLVYFGTGKGKTTAAMGVVARALGRGYRVIVAQFMKAMPSGEAMFYRSSNYEELLRWFLLGTKEFITHGDITSTPGDITSDTALVNTALIYGFLHHILPKLLEEFRPKLVVLDELGIATHLGLVDEWSVLEALQPFIGNRERHAIVTGRYVPSTIRDVADLVSEVREIKHYFRKGIASLKGIDY